MPEFKFKRVCPRDPPAHLECMGGKAIRILNVFLGRRDSYECQPPDTVSAAELSYTKWLDIL